MQRPSFTGAALGFYTLLAVAALAWVAIRGSRPTIARPTEIGLDLALGVAVGLGLVGGWALARRVSDRMRELEELVREITGPLELHEVVLLAAVSGLVEELFFRGAMLPSWGIVVSTLIFGLLHTGPGPAFRMWTAFALVAGALFAGLVVWRESLLAAIVAHATVNGIQLGRLALSPRSGTTPRDEP